MQSILCATTVSFNSSNKATVLNPLRLKSAIYTNKPIGKVKSY